MCGIAGVVSLGPPLGEDDERLAASMTAALAHRGPDGSGLLADERCALGNRRLRVTDLSDAAAMPMVGEESGAWLSFNGAITNFRELRRSRRLDARRPLRTGSDTEVLLRLWEERGAGCLSELSGMFAFALYDRRGGTFHLARDFYGLRPMFYAVKNGRLHFASEIKALLKAPGLAGELDREALWHYFTLGYVPGRATPFSGIRELPAGRRLEVELRSGKLREIEFHRLSYEPDESLSEEAAAGRLRELLLESVSRCLSSDAPAGLTLSGGFDTSGLLGLAKELGVSRRVHTFSLRIDSPSFDESRWQRLMVDWARPIHHEITVRPEDVEEQLYRSVAHMDEPSADGAVIPSLLLAKAAGEHVSVLLSGEGGDEVFNAYETHRAWRARGLYRGLVPAPARRLIAGLARLLPASYEKLSFDFLSKRFTEGAELGVPESHLHWRHVLGEDEKRRLLPGWAPSRPTAALFRELYDSLPFEDELNRLSALDLRYYFIDDLMVKNDRMLMARSIETRFPYMDRSVVEFASRIPTGLKLKGFRGRHIQKAALRGLVPPEIERRGNMGLEMPHSLWFLGALRPLAEKHFARERISRSGLLDPDAVSALWAEHLAGRRDNGRALWAVLNFSVWHELYVDGGGWEQHLLRPAPAPEPARLSS